jgi:dihydrofolate synthase/folylpolyglutamate synthase
VAGDLARVEAALAERWPESRIDLTLDRIAALLDVLGSPQRAYPAVHVAGTNGKTSTTRMVDALLREHGLRTGRYTSPHLESVTERISVAGRPLGVERFVAAYDEIAGYLPLVDARQRHPLSFFEVLTGMAFSVFADAPVDVAAVEVGLGGRWDATNVVDAPVAVITPVDLDHTRHLGDTVAAIAGEKAGIIKPGATVVAGRQAPEAAAVLDERAAAQGARLLAAGTDFAVSDRAIAHGGQVLRLRGVAGEYPDVFLPLHGAHQADNAATALAAVEAFLGRALDHDLVRAGFAAADSPGRLEVVRRAPTVLLDGAHNPAGARALAAALAEAFRFDRLVAVLGVPADKDVAGLLAPLGGLVDVVVASQNSTHRALPAEGLAAVAAEVLGGDRVVVQPSLPAALETALTLAGEGGGRGAGVLVTGSIVTAGEARRLLREAAR